MWSKSLILTKERDSEREEKRNEELVRETEIYQTSMIIGIHVRGPILTRIQLDGISNMQ
jgi:hypothetical protein